MNVIIFVLSIFVFIKTIGYGLFEQKENDNWLAAIVIYILAFICFIAPNIILSFI